MKTIQVNVADCEEESGNRIIANGAIASCGKVIFRGGNNLLHLEG